MYHTVGKLTALAAVVGIGVAVVVHAQRGIQEGNDVAANQPAAGDEKDDANAPEKDDAALGDMSDLAEPDLFANSGIVKTSGTRNLNDVPIASKANAGSRAASDSDPFEMGDDEPADETPPSRPAAKTQAAASPRDIDIVDVPDGEDPNLEEPKQLPKQLQAATQPKPIPAAARPRVQTLDEPDAVDAARENAAPKGGPAVKGGPRLLSADDDDSDDSDEEPPTRAASRPPAAKLPAARVDTTDPFADDDTTAADAGNKPSRAPVAGDDRDDGDVSMDDEPAEPPPAKALNKPDAVSKSGSHTKPFQRNPALDPDEDDDVKRDADRMPVAVQPETTRQPRLPAELGRTIEAEDVGAEPAAPKPELPDITIEKTAPATAVLGRPMIYQIHVRNVGHNAAHQVVVEDVVPEGVKIDGSIPQALLKDNRLIWKIGTLAAGQEKKISVRVIPQSEGTIGGVATVNFAAEPAPDPKAASPQLKFDVTAPRKAAVGTPIEFNFRIRNTGHVPASGVVIRDILPAGLKHDGGNDLEYAIGDLPAGKTKEVQLILTASQPGPTVNKVVVTADGNVAEEAQVPLDIVGPSLAVVREGPKRLFPNKTGVYSNTVTNPGLSQVFNVNVVETVPPGMEFVEASDGGKYNAAKRSVTWSISQLLAGGSKTVKVTLRSNARGAQVSVVRVSDAAGSTGETVGATHVTGVSALTIEIGEIPALIEAGEIVKLSARVINRGSDAAANVRVTIALPAGMQLVDAQGPTSHREAAASTGEASGERATRGSIDVQFEPIARLEPQADATIELTLKARTPGTARLEVQAQCDQLPKPIHREEVTTIVSP